jgi:hypothetical protein
MYQLHSTMDYWFYGIYFAGLGMVILGCSVFLLAVIIYGLIPATRPWISRNGERYGFPASLTLLYLGLVDTAALAGMLCYVVIHQS